MNVHTIVKVNLATRTQCYCLSCLLKKILTTSGKKVLVAPLGIKDIEYDDTKPKEAYIGIGFREVKIGTTTQQNHYLANNIQAQRK